MLMLSAITSTYIGIINRQQFLCNPNSAEWRNPAHIPPTWGHDGNAEEEERTKSTRECNNDHKVRQTIKIAETVWTQGEPEQAAQTEDVEAFTDTNSSPAYSDYSNIIFL
jgi:hypothetical protein